MTNNKFRAWYETGKTWLYFTIGQQLSDIDEAMYSKLCIDGENFYQYIGLKDKNGKECYHKDIGLTSEGLKGIIEWDESRYAWVFQDEMKFNELLFHKSMDIEIIGNIFENNNPIE